MYDVSAQFFNLFFSCFVIVREVHKNDYHLEEVCLCLGDEYVSAGF